MGISGRSRVAGEQHDAAAEVAEAWFHDEYEPVVEMLREADLVRRGTETETYMRVAHLRYLILRTHSWDDDVIEVVRKELETPSWEEDTMVQAVAEGAALAPERSLEVASVLPHAAQQLPHVGETGSQLRVPDLRRQHRILQGREGAVGSRDGVDGVVDESLGAG